MTRRAKLSREEVEIRLDENQRRKLSHLWELADILGRSIVNRDYKPTDQLLESIRLSAYGSWLLAQAKKYEFPSREARLTCLLELFHLDLLVDLDTTEPELVAAAISEEIRTGRIRFPFIFGPDLYMKAAELFPDERRILNANDTRRLLEDQPVGVFHHGKWLGGPWGLVTTSHERRIVPRQEVPLQHCHDVACWKVHRVRLSTDSGAEINKARHAINLALESEGEDPSEFVPVLSETFKDPQHEYDEKNYATVPHLIGDALALPELKLLARELLDGVTARNFRSSVESVCGRKGHSIDIVSDLDRAQLLQLVLLATDEEIVAALDKLIYAEDSARSLAIAKGELRRSVLTSTRSGAFGNLLEISRLGVRAKPHMNIAALRLQKLIKMVYDPTDPDPSSPSTSPETGTNDLDWQLRHIPGPSIDARLSEYLRKAQPTEVLRRLVLNTRDNIEVAAAYMSLSFEAVSDGDLVERILWKLGFEVDEGDELHEAFWRHSERLRRAAETASVSSNVGEEEMREISGSYFPSLERLLNDSLAYITWALTTDHVTSSDPYRYVFDEKVAALVTSQLGEKLHDSGDLPDPKASLDRWTLQPLCRGFAALAEILGELESTPAAFLRQESSLPEFESWTSIQRFPFSHTVPFLDLTSDSRAKLRATLSNTSGALTKSGVLELRNSLLHFRRSNVDLDQLVDALGKVEIAVRQLESVGLVRILFHRQRVETDRWNRSLHILKDGMSRELAISRPGKFAWLNLPVLDVPQYLMTIAQFDELDEYLRFRPGADSQYRELWSALPQRRLESVAGTIDAPSQESEAAGQMRSTT